jgi:hypothetical protein
VLRQAIESLIFGNIPAYADGTDLWAKPTGDYKAQRVDDKVVEVRAIFPLRSAPCETVQYLTFMTPR